MKVIEDGKPASKGLPDSPGRIQGRVDAIDGVHVFGWARHAGAPAERLTIEAVAEGKVVATAVADRARIDLRRNGIGDGSHAFNIELPPEVAGNASAIELRAIAASGEHAVLRFPSHDERAVEAAVATPLARVLERLDVIAGAQRHVQLLQREKSDGIKEVMEQIASLCAEGGKLEKAVTEAARSQVEISERTGAIEVFLSRFDQTLAGFDARMKALERSTGGDGRWLTVILATVVGFVAGAVLILFAR